jgi:hypothetical protein
MEGQSASPLLAAFSRLGDLVRNQKEVVAKHNPKDAYGEGGDPNFEADCMKLLVDGYEDMAVGKDDEEHPWVIALYLKEKGLVDGEKLYQSLRKLSDEDVVKVRSFNRFVGQQLYSTTVDEFYELQETKLGLNYNPFYQKFTDQTRVFAAFFGKNLETPPWPQEKLQSVERDQFVRKVTAWIHGLRELPGIRIAHDFFSRSKKECFNAFFHIQRQFDSPNYRDLDPKGAPYPQPLPRIASYRSAIAELSSEFTDLEGSVSMCFDYCRMSVGKVVGFVLGAEDVFLRITSRLDRDYPIDVDYAHKVLFHRAHDVKMMIFPLRCLFFDELEAKRSNKDSTDNTLDSYMDMTLGRSEVHLPPSYVQNFKPSELEGPLQQALIKICGKTLPTVWSTPQLIAEIQNYDVPILESLSVVFDGLCNEYEERFKSDENNVNRRVARMSWLYCKAMAKREVMSKASQNRLSHIKNMADKYAGHAERFAKADVGPETDLRSLSDDQLPLMASPQQMEDLFRTAHVVGRLGKDSVEFKETALKIEEGLKAALDMMKKAGELMERMVTKMFPDKEDSKDLLEAIRSLIELGYRSHQAISDLARKEGSASKDKKGQDEVLKLRADVEKCKKDTAELQGHLRVVLGSKRELVEKMRITKAEKDYYHGQLRMITVMTIQSIQSQSA